VRFAWGIRQRVAQNQKRILFGDRAPLGMPASLDGLAFAVAAIFIAVLTVTVHAIRIMM
jgi:hypothetical protein